MRRMRLFALRLNGAWPFGGPLGPSTFSARRRNKLLAAFTTRSQRRPMLRRI